jgi:SAM-dependent methyltransferase
MESASPGKPEAPGTASDLGRPDDAAPRMLQLLNSFLTVQALHVAAGLGIADLLADGPVSVEDLAAATGAHRPSLYRLLRMLAGAGVFTEEADGRFALTALGGTLRSEGPASVRDWALYLGAPETWEVWGRLHETVMTGEPGFLLARGMPMWDYLAEKPELRAPFDRWMTRQSDQHNAAIAAGYDFSGFRTLADIGGGQGSTLAAILRANPSLRGILLDLPQVVADHAPLEADGLADRCEVVGGDMLLRVPPGADAYLVKRVLMDWGDEQATRILRNCAEALRADGRLLVVEMVLLPGNEPSPARAFDLLMLLMHKGARVRTEAEFRDLFAAAGLLLTRVIPTASPNSILEGVPG